MNEPFVTKIITKLAPSIDAQVLVEPEYCFVGRITFKNGRRSYFRGSRLDINFQGAAEVAKDKGYTSFFLNQLGYSTPVGQTFFREDLCQRVSNKRSIEDGYQFARSIGFPVIVKPNDLAQGTLVAKVYNKKEYFGVARKIFNETQVLLVQRFYSGRDYRIVILDDEVIAAYERRPLSVTGDGISTVEDLLGRKHKDLSKNVRLPLIDINDFRIRKKLDRGHISLTDIPKKGAHLPLLDNANLSSGGEAVDVTQLVHTDFAALALNLTKAMGLRFCGVDILTEDLGSPINQGEQFYVVIEINAAPGLENYASIGSKQTKAVEELYLKILKKIESQ